MPEPEQVLGDYVLLEQVGRGAHSVVHRGRRRDRAGRIVAVKRLATSADPRAVDALRREADTLASLAHPAVVALLDVVDDPAGGIALVLPWAPGGSLEDVLQREGALPWDQVADLGARLASALASAHGAGILHRDVKPANVLLGAEDEPRLADFGTARLRADAPDAPAGTAEYVDPAVVVDGADPSPRSDGYSLGVVLYRALSGQLPYAGGSPAATIAAADRGVHPRLADLVPDAPARLVDAVERAMARDPDDRFGSVQQLQVALEPLVRDHEADRWAGLAHQLDDAPPRTGAPAPPPSMPPPPPGPDTDGPVAATPPAPGDSGTRVFGPPPRSRTADASRPRRPWWAIPAVVGVVVVPVLLVAWVVLAGGGDAPAPGGAATAAPSAAATAPTATPSAAPRVAPTPCDGAALQDEPGVVLAADVDGRGCALLLTVTEEEVDGEPTLVLTLPDAAGEVAGRYAIGAPGDVVLVGDWDCDGTDTPALHRPATGEVFLYHGYGQVDPEVGSRLPGGAEAVVVTGASGCDAVAAS